MRVSLTPQEVAMAAQVGVRRQLSAIVKGLPDRHGADPGKSWQLHIEGACGELALAKALGRYWGGSVDVFRTEADVGKLEVRTRSKDWYELIVRDDDANDSVFVLVTGAHGEYDIRGWILGRDAKNAWWWHAYGGRASAFFVPQDQLQPISSLMLA